MAGFFCNGDEKNRPVLPSTLMSVERRAPDLYDADMPWIPPQAARPSSPDAPPPEAADGVLLGSFLTGRDQAAFEQLLRRHGGKVMGLFRRLGLQEADAEDGFQATFLTLVRKAGSIGKRDALAAWLYKVAYRIALEQRARARQRRAREHALTGDEPAPPMDHELKEFWALLDAEVIGLPEKYRAPFVLCHLQGLSLEQAARQLGRPLGTVGTWLARARNLLRSRLAKRGLVLTVAAVVTYLGEQPPAQAALSQAVLHSALQAALHLQTGAAVPAEILALSDRAVRALSLAKLKLLALVAAAVLTVGAVGAAVVPRWIPTPPPEDWLSLWGTVIDPDGDSRFAATRTSLTVKVAGGPHALGDRGRPNAPRVVRKVEGDFLVQVKVSPTVPPADPAAFERNLFPEPGQADSLNSSAFYGAGILVAQDGDNSLQFEEGSVLREGGPRQYLALHTRSGGTARHGEAMPPGDGPFRHLRVERIGPHLFPACSPDGERWRYFPAVTRELPEVLGVALVAGHNTSQGFEVTFSEYRLHRFNYGNNPGALRKDGPPPAQGCARCHSHGVPQADPEFHFRWNEPDQPAEKR
jgi:RNA polymerase sigma factor (sigma-70 family)